MIFQSIFVFGLVTAIEENLLKGLSKDGRPLICHFVDIPNVDYYVAKPCPFYPGATFPNQCCRNPASLVELQKWICSSRPPAVFGPWSEVGSGPEGIIYQSSMITINSVASRFLFEVSTGTGKRLVTGITAFDGACSTANYGPCDQCLDPAIAEVMDFEYQVSQCGTLPPSIFDITETVTRHCGNSTICCADQRPTAEGFARDFCQKGVSTPFHLPFYISGSPGDSPIVLRASHYSSGNDPISYDFTLSKIPEGGYKIVNIANYLSDCSNPLNSLPCTTCSVLKYQESLKKCDAIGGIISLDSIMYMDACPTDSTMLCNPDAPPEDSSPLFNALCPFQEGTIIGDPTLFSGTYGDPSIIMQSMITINTKIFDTRYFMIADEPNGPYNINAISFLPFSIDPAEHIPCSACPKPSNEQYVLITEGALLDCYTPAFFETFYNRSPCPNNPVICCDQPGDDTDFLTQICTSSPPVTAGNITQIDPGQQDWWSGTITINGVVQRLIYSFPPFKIQKMFYPPIDLTLVADGCPMTAAQLDCSTVCGSSS